MFKRVLLVFLAFLALVVVLVSLPIAGVGCALYPVATGFELSLYGLTTRTVDVGDTTLTISTNELKPDRETIVFIHGFSSDRFIYARFAKYFTDDYNVILPDLAGHGDSAYDPALSYSYEAQTRRVAEMLDTLGIPKVHITGNSMGGGIAAHFAIAYPDRTLSSALFDAAALTSPEPSDMDQMLAQGRNPFEVHNRKEFKEFYKMTMERPPYLPSSLLAFMASEYQRKRPELQRIFNELRSTGALDDRLGELTAPTLIVWGARDRLLHVSAAEVFREGISNSSVVVFDDYGHMPQFEAPKESAAVYRAFLEGLPD